MKAIIHIFIVGIILLMQMDLFAQKKMGFNEFQTMVVKYHPLSLKINLKTDLANWYLVKAKGNFDPKLYGRSYQKYLNDQTQFSMTGGELKIPTRSPISIESGYDLNSGNFLNPESKTGNNGLLYAGVSLNVLQGLLTDVSRTELKKAELFQEMTVAEQQILLNDLLFYSGKAYWEWFTSYHIFKTYEDAQKLALDRFEFIKQSAELGDRPLFDTIESSIFKQNISVLYEQAKTNYENSILQISLFLWDDQLNALVLDSNIIPLSPEEIKIDDSLLIVIAGLRDKLINHPELKLYEYKAENLLLDRKLYLEQIKPELNLKYNFLNEALNQSPLLSMQNYTWGLHFHLPVFLRKERANLKITDIKMKDNQYDWMYKTNYIKTEFETSYNLWELTSGQLLQWKSIVENNNLLLNGENELFRAGESSIFMINTRQVNFLNAKLKYFEVISKNNETLLSTFKAAGLLNSDL